MAVARETKLRLPKARLPSSFSFTNSCVKMTVGSKSESSSTQSSVKSECSYAQRSVKSESSFTLRSVKTESSRTRSSVKIPVGPKFESASTGSSVKMQVGSKSESLPTKNRVKMPVGPKSLRSCGRSGEPPLKENSINPNSKASSNTICLTKARDAAGRVLSKTPNGFKPKQEFSSCDTILPVDSLVDDDKAGLDLFKGRHYDRALAELNLQPEKLSPERKIIASSVGTKEKPEILSPIDGSRYNPIQEAVLVLHPSDATRAMSCGNVAGNWEKSPTDIDSEDKCFTPSKESIGSNSILSSATASARLNDYLSSYVGEKLLSQNQECDRISSHSSVLTQGLDETETEPGKFKSNGLSFHYFLSEANKIGDHLLSCSAGSVLHCKSCSYSHDKLAPRCPDYQDETSFDSTIENFLTLKTLKHELENNNDRQDPLYWPLNPESYWTIEGCCGT